MPKGLKIRERRGEEGGLLEEGINPAEPDVIAGIDAKPEML